MKVLHTTTKEVLYLEEIPFAKGGEGSLHKVIAPQQFKGLVAKLYYKNKRSSQRRHKLRYLIKNPPVFENKAQASLVSWPIAMLEQQQQFVGFLMPQAYGESLEILATSKMPKHLPEIWQRFQLGNEAALKLRLKACFNIAVALYHIHQTGHYVMVDFKPDNILIQSNGLISLVDMDSIEIVKGQQMLFPAAMATPEYAPPEFHGLQRSAKALPLSWDTFSMAIIFYKLVLGIHPFAASTKGKYEGAVSLGEKIKHGLFVHNKKHKNDFSTIPFPHQALFSLPVPVQYLFKLCFVEGIHNLKARPSAEDWCQALGDGYKRVVAVAEYEFPTKFEVLPVIHSDLEAWRFLQFSFEYLFETQFQLHADKIAQKFKKKFHPINWLKEQLFLKKKAEKHLEEMPYLKLELEKPLSDNFYKKVKALYQTQQANQLIYKQLLLDYESEKQTLLEEWEQEVDVFQEKIRKLNQGKREKMFEVLQHRNEQALWKQFVGKTAKQKQQYLQKKFLPQRVHELEATRDAKIKAIDEEHQATWRALELEHYANLAKIDKSAAHLQLKSKVKEKEEKRFVAERQLIIDAILEQKTMAENHCRTQIDISQVAVENYRKQLEAIEDEVQNKNRTIKDSYDASFKKVEIAIEKRFKIKKVEQKNAQHRFEMDAGVLDRAIQELALELGVVLSTFSH